MRTRVSVAAMDSLPYSEDSESHTLESVVRGHHVGRLERLSIAWSLCFSRDWTRHVHAGPIEGTLVSDLHEQRSILSNLLWSSSMLCPLSHAHKHVFTLSECSKVWWVWSGHMAHPARLCGQSWPPSSAASGPGCPLGSWRRLF